MRPGVLRREEARRDMTRVLSRKTIAVLYGPREGSYSDAQKCILAADQGGCWILRNKVKKKVCERSKAAGSQPASGKHPSRVHNMCRFTRNELPCQSRCMLGLEASVGTECERRGEGSFALTGTGTGTLACLPSDLETTPGSLPGQRASLV